MFVYVWDSEVFGRQIVSEIKRTPFGVSIVFNDLKPMPAEEVKKLLTRAEIMEKELVIGLLEIES